LRSSEEGSQKCNIGEKIRTRLQGVQGVTKDRSRNRTESSGDKNLVGMAYRKIKERMLSYDLVPGQRLVFVDLATRLGVSRTPVNIALSILANEDLDHSPSRIRSTRSPGREMPL
jgi:hypothetical protein